ncbi:MAG: acyl-CoA thioesterase [Bacteroidota bacterium]
MGLSKKSPSEIEQEVRFKHTRESQITMTQLMLPSYSNFSGKIHGGYILNLMDQIAFACASKHSGHYCVTASVNKVDFLTPIEVGELVTLKASVNYTGRTSMVVGLRVESENIQQGFVKHCNSSYFTMVAKNERGESVPVPGLILEDKEGVRRFARSIRRKQQAAIRDHSFRPDKFEVAPFLEILAQQNVRVEL